MICDGAGSSAYQLSNPLQRYLRDIDVLANHIGDIDVLKEAIALAKRRMLDASQQQQQQQ